MEAVAFRDKDDRVSLENLDGGARDQERDGPLPGAEGTGDIGTRLPEPLGVFQLETERQSPGGRVQSRGDQGGSTLLRGAIFPFDPSFVSLLDEALKVRGQGEIHPEKRGVRQGEDRCPGLQVVPQGDLSADDPSGDGGL